MDPVDLITASTDWARAEMFSTRFFIFFAGAFLAASLGFWRLGQTDIARAYVIPLLVAGVLLMAIGLGLFFTNKARVGQFEAAHAEDAAAFIQSEITRAEATLREYDTVVFKAIPLLLVVAALIIAFVSTPVWRASAITAMAMLIVILLVDGTAHARIEGYYQQLLAAEGGLAPLPKPTR